MQELALGTDPLDPDSDGDGFGDGEEAAAGSDPMAAGSTPAAAIPALGPLARLLLLGSLLAAGEALRRRFRP